MWGLVLDATQHLASGELGDRAAQENPHAKQGNWDAGPQPWEEAGDSAASTCTVYS